MPEIVTLVVTDGWDSLLQGRTRQTLELDVLPQYLAGRRWFPERDANAIVANVAETIPLQPRRSRHALAVVDAQCAGSKPSISSRHHCMATA